MRLPTGERFCLCLVLASLACIPCRGQAYGSLDKAKIESLISEHAKECLWAILDFDANQLPFRHVYSGLLFKYTIDNTKWDDQSVTFDLKSSANFVGFGGFVYHGTWKLEKQFGGWRTVIAHPSTHPAERVFLPFEFHSGVLGTPNMPGLLSHDASGLLVIDGRFVFFPGTAERQTKEYEVEGKVITKTIYTYARGYVAFVLQYWKTSDAPAQVQKTIRSAPKDMDSDADRDISELSNGPAVAAHKKEVINNMAVNVVRYLMYRNGEYYEFSISAPLDYKYGEGAHKFLASFLRVSK
jgi:hypothetical protein